jgi:uncharacterized protein
MTSIATRKGSEVPVLKARQFDDLQFITLLDEERSGDEERYIGIGLSNKRRLLVVAHTERTDAIRIISPRKAAGNKQTFYQEAG